VAPGYAKAIRDGLFIAGLIALVYMVGGSYVGGNIAGDAQAYWQAAHGPMYLRPDAGGYLAYLYSPAFEETLWPLFRLPYPVFLAIWYGLSSAALVYLTRSMLPLALATVVVPMVITNGNIEILMALAIAVGFRYPAAWAFVLLTKVLPGVGLLWFAVRREWRSLAVAVGATGLIAGVSFLVDPSLWATWFRALAANSQLNLSWPLLPIPPLVRLPIAAAVVSFGATRNWRWTVPVAATIAMPTLWPVNMSVLVAVIPLAREAGVRRAAMVDPPSQPENALAGG
jgi:Glycosyltransferase family 87